MDITVFKRKEIPIVHEIGPELMILYVFGCIWLYSYVHNLNEWVLAIRCRFSQITFRNSRPQVFCKKIPVLEFLFNKFAGLWPTTLLKRHSRSIKKILWHKCFPVNFVKFLKTSILQNNCEFCFCTLEQLYWDIWEIFTGK